MNIYISNFKFKEKCGKVDKRRSKISFLQLVVLRESHPGGRPRSTQAREAGGHRRLHEAARYLRPCVRHPAGLPRWAGTLLLPDGEPSLRVIKSYNDCDG